MVTRLPVARAESRSSLEAGQCRLVCCPLPCEAPSSSPSSIPPAPTRPSFRGVGGGEDPHRQWPADHPRRPPSAPAPRRLSGFPALPANGEQAHGLMGCDSPGPSFNPPSGFLASLTSHTQRLSPNHGSAPRPHDCPGVGGPRGGKAAVPSPFTLPYSRVYEADTVGPGSFPRFRTSTQPKPSSWARDGPNRKPRESRPVGESWGVKGQLCGTAA